MNFINLNKIAFNKHDLQYVYVHKNEDKYSLVIVFKNSNKHYIEYKNEVDAEKALCVVVNKINECNAIDLFE